MKVVVVATGLIGKAVATLLTDKGYEVVQASRNTQPSLNIDDPASIDAFYKTLGEVDAIICAAGNAGYGSLAELSDEEFQLGIRSKILRQVHLVRKGLSNVRPGGVFILTGGIFADRPWPKTSGLAMACAGVDGFVRGAALDLQDEGGTSLLSTRKPFASMQFKMEWTGHTFQTPQRWPKRISKHWRTKSRVNLSLSKGMGHRETSIPIL